MFLKHAQNLVYTKGKTWFTQKKKFRTIQQSNKRSVANTVNEL